MLKFSQFFLGISLLFLLSCQHNNDDNDDSVSKKYNRENAALYNSQLGLAYLKQGDRPRAKKKLLTAMKEAPDSPNVNASMGYFLEKSGEFKEAESYYKKAITLSNGSGAQLNNFGTYLCRRGQYTQAEDYFLKAVKDIQYEHTAGAYENAGLCVMEIPNFSKATLYFNKALEQDPNRKQSLYELIKISLKENKQEEILATLAKYQSLVLADREILELAIEIAQKANKPAIEAQYRSHLNQLKFSDTPGVKNEHNSDNG